MMPLSSLVSAVMQGVGEPYLIVKGAASPHTAALKPSDATALSEAKAIFWIGPQLENFLVKMTVGATSRGTCKDAAALQAASGSSDALSCRPRTLPLGSRSVPCWMSAAKPRATSRASMQHAGSVVRSRRS